MAPYWVRSAGVRRARLDDLRARVIDFFPFAIIAISILACVLLFDWNLHQLPAALFVLAVSSVGATALVEVLKRLLRIRSMYQERQVQVWFAHRSSLSGELAFEDLLRIVGTTSGTSVDRRTFFDLSIEQLSAQIADAGDQAAQTPGVYPALYEVLIGPDQSLVAALLDDHREQLLGMLQHRSFLANRLPALSAIPDRVWATSPYDSEDFDDTGSVALLREVLEMDASIALRLDGDLERNFGYFFHGGHKPTAKEWRVFLGAWDGLADTLRNDVLIDSLLYPTSRYREYEVRAGGGPAIFGRNYAYQLPLEYLPLARRDHITPDMHKISTASFSLQEPGLTISGSSDQRSQNDPLIRLRRNVDLLQISVGSRWRRYVSVLAVSASGGIGLLVGVLGEISGTSILGIACFIVGGFVSWTLRDCAAILERLRRAPL